MSRVLTITAAAALSLLLCACAGPSQAQQTQLTHLENDNQALRAQLSERQKAAHTAHLAAGNAEATAGLTNASCTVVSPASGKPGPSGGAVHAKLLLAPTTFLLQPKLQPARRAGNANVSAGACEVGKR